MIDHTNISYNTTNNSSYGEDDGPSLHTRLVFAGAWIFIAVVGIIGKGNTSLATTTDLF